MPLATPASQERNGGGQSQAVTKRPTNLTVFSITRRKPIFSARPGGLCAPSERKCSVASNDTVLSQCYVWESQPFQTSLVWTERLQDLAASVGVLEGWEGYSNFHQCLKIACPGPKKKKRESPANNHSFVLPVRSIWSENVSFFRRGLGKCRHHACCPE